MSHLAQDALGNRLPKGACKACPRNLARMGRIDCRQTQPLNGRDAAHEFTRNLRPWARQAVGL